MHLSEGILPFKQVLVTASLAIPCVYDSYKQYRQSTMALARNETKPLVTMAFALCFAVTLLPIPVPIIGASSHMCATPLLALIFGPRIMAFPVFGVLLLHALFFAHGGISTLGANVLTLGVMGPWITWLSLRMLAMLRFNTPTSIGLSCFIGSISVYFADTILLSWALVEKQYFCKTFQSVSLSFLPVQGPLSILEATVSATVLVYLTKYRHDFVPDFINKMLLKKRPRGRVPAFVLVAIFIAITTIGLSFRAYSFEGIDDSVFTKTAEGLGVNGWGTALPQIQGELELFMFSLGFFIAGMCVGKSWEKLRFFLQEKRTTCAS